MLRDLVVFEIERNGKSELDFRLIRGALPGGAKPLAIADRHGFAVVCGEEFSTDEVAAYAEQQSGYRPEKV
jgi:hypothetical protein